MKHPFQTSRIWIYLSGPSGFCTSSLPEIIVDFVSLPESGALSLVDHQRAFRDTHVGLQEGLETGGVSQRKTLDEEL